MDQDSYAVSVLYDWFKTHQKYFHETNMKMEFKDSGFNSACVFLESESYLMQICAWDHASCLDIEIMKIQTEEVTFPHTGDCENKAKFEFELKNFLEWHESEFKNT